MPIAFTIAAAFVFGLLIGSFLNACAYRIPRGISIARGRSFCPRCKAQIRAYDNIPLASWIVLRGRCRDCGAPISIRYPLVEALTAVLFAGLAAYDGLTPLLLAHFVFVATLILVSDIDLSVRIIPDVVILPAAAVGLAMMIAIDPGRWMEWLFAGLGAAAFLFLAGLIYEKLRRVEGMGMGDVKMALCMGFFLGWSVVPAMFLAFVIGAVVGIVLMSRGETGKTAIPFGPFLAVGAVISLFLGPTLIHAYLHLALRS